MRAWGAALGTALVSFAGCGDEQAVVVDVSVQADGDRLCLAVFGDGEVVFERAYRGETGNPPGGTLTLVAGDRVNARVRVSGWLDRGGQIVARGSGETGFGALDSVHLALPVRRCHEVGAGSVPALRSLGTFEPAPGAALAAADVDGDGRDELLLAAADGTVAVIDAEAGGSTRTLDVALPAGALPVAEASLGDDCFVDVLFASAAGAVVLRSPGSDAESQPALPPAARSVGIGRFEDGTSIAIAGAAGLAVVAWPSGDATMLDAGAWRSVAVADITRDGFSDLIASGDGGAAVWLGSGAGPSRVAGALPASFGGVTGPVATGDLDGDAALDVVGAAGTEVRVSRNRGDGLLEDRTGLAPPASAAGLEALLLADFDGDCRDDLVMLDADGAVAVFRSGDDLTLVPVAVGVEAAAAISGADVNGDHLRELAILTRTGEVLVWER